MKAEDTNLVVAVFTVMAAIITGANALVVRLAPEAHTLRPLRWSERIRSHLLAQLLLIPASLLIALWVVPVCLELVEYVKGTVPVEAEPPPPLQACAGIDVPGYPDCAHDVWRDTQGHCEVPKTVFVLSTGSRQKDMEIYCLQLDLRYRSTPQKP